MPSTGSSSILSCRRYAAEVLADGFTLVRADLPASLKTWCVPGTRTVYARQDATRAEVARELKGSLFFAGQAEQTCDYAAELLLE